MMLVKPISSSELLMLALHMVMSILAMDQYWLLHHSQIEFM